MTDVAITWNKSVFKLTPAFFLLLLEEEVAEREEEDEEPLAEPDLAEEEPLDEPLAEAFEVDMDPVPDPEYVAESVAEFVPTLPISFKAEAQPAWVVADLTEAEPLKSQSDFEPPLD